MKKPNTFDPKKMKKNWDYFECHICKCQTEDEDEIIYCGECERPTCEKCVGHVEYQGFSDSLCMKCIKESNIKEYWTYKDEENSNNRNT